MPKKSKIKLYLDTSVPSAYFDTSKPVRQLITQKWFENEALSYELYVSVITVEEIEKLTNETKKKGISELIVRYKMKILSFSEKAKELSDEYMNRGAIPKSEPLKTHLISQ